MDTSTTTCALSNAIDLGGGDYEYTDLNCSTEHSFTIASNEAGFTWGEIVSGFLLFTILIVLAYTFLYNWVKGQKVRA